LATMAQALRPLRTANATLRDRVEARCRGVYLPCCCCSRNVTRCLSPNLRYQIARYDSGQEHAPAMFNRRVVGSNLTWSHPPPRAVNSGALRRDVSPKPVGRRRTTEPQLRKSSSAASHPPPRVPRPRTRQRED
jgi:hypothetical protein